MEFKHLEGNTYEWRSRRPKKSVADMVDAFSDALEEHDITSDPLTEKYLYDGRKLVGFVFITEDEVPC